MVICTEILFFFDSKLRKRYFLTIIDSHNKSPESHMASGCGGTLAIFHALRLCCYLYFLLAVNALRKAVGVQELFARLNHQVR